MKLWTFIFFSLLSVSGFAQTKLMVGQGEYQAFIIKNDTLYGLGGGATGIGTNTGIFGLPILCQFATGGQPKVRYIASGLHSSFCIVDSASGNVYGTGDDDGCWQGNCSLAAKSNFVRIPLDNLGHAFGNVRNISANAYPGRIDTTSSILFTKYDGTLWHIGSNRNGNAGDSTLGTGIDSLPKQIPFPTGTFIDTALTYLDNMALDSAGNVWTWGGNGFFGVYLGRSGSALVPHKITIPGGVRIIQIAGGEYTNYALGSNGHVYAWGFYTSFMGIGIPFSSNTQYTTPTDITSSMNLHGHTVLQITKIHTSSMALLDDSTIRTWGDNPEGSAGFGNQLNWFTTTNPFLWDEGRGENVIDTLVSPLPCVTNVSKIYGGGYYVLYNYIQTSDGRLFAAGRNKNGVICSGIVDGDPGGQIEATYPESWNDTVFRQLNPFGQTSNAKTASPYCALHPTGSPCTNYSIPTNAAPTVSAGSNQSISTTTASLSGTATPHSSTVAVTYWTSPICGVSFANPFSLSTTVSGLPLGTTTLTLTARDANSKVSSATVNITVSSTQNFYVSSSTGSDGNSGTSTGSPFATLSKIHSLGLIAGDSVFLKAGDVFNGVLYPASGVYYGSYGTGAKPVINGFTTISSWTSMGGNVYEALCTGCSVRTNLVTLDGNIQSMGRWPDTGWRTYTGITSTSITDASLSGSPYNWTGAYAAVMDEFYIIDTASITSQSGGLTFGSSLASTNARGKGYFIFNDARTLLLTSHVGSWYFNHTTDSLQVYFGSGGPTGHTVKVSTSDTLFYASSVSNVTVNGLDFEGSNEFSIYENNTSNMTFTNCNFNYAGNNIILANNCPGNTFTNDTLQYANNNGAYITGSTSQHNVVSNCYIANIGLIPGMGHGSGTGVAGYTGWSNFSGFNTWTGNTFKNIGYDGIGFSGDSCNVVNNYIDSFCMVKVDGGGVYTWDASFATYTYGRNIKNNVIIYGLQPASTSGIAYDSTDQSFGVYCDGHSKTVNVVGNSLSYNRSGGVFIHGASITVDSNTIYANGFSQVLITENAGVITGLVMKKNVIANSTTGQFLSNFNSTGNDLSSFGTVDSNYYVGPSSTTTPFHTKSSVDGGTQRSLSSWQSTLSYDTHSTLQLGSLNYVYNPTSSSTNAPISGVMKDVYGNSYSVFVPLNPYSSAVLLIQNSVNYIRIPLGFRVQWH